MTPNPQLPNKEGDVEAKEQTILVNCGENVKVNVLPCPFCGAQPEIIHQGNQYTKTQALTFKCSNWECRIERTDKITQRQTIEWLIPIAVASWNKRARASQQPSALIALALDLSQMPSTPLGDSDCISCVAAHHLARLQEQARALLPHSPDTERTE